MPDLHTWITEQVARVERAANNHQQPSPNWEYDPCVREIRDLTNSGTVANVYRGGTGEHIALHDPAAVLRRCEADRKILEEHKPRQDSWYDHYACEGCGYDGAYCSEPNTQHVNDCPTLLALAEGYGLTQEQRATLARPEAERAKPSPGPGMPDVLAQQMIRIGLATVPAGLRGPNWKPRR
ncbi:DUF6221 family protein [Streptomyces sp. NBC_01508]|uniref:DUF6221 family protein n=1 Tax=Streptomyces sp. NBC_01508 TaxID=2903888 RepID=UPI003867C5A0